MSDIANIIVAMRRDYARDTGGTGLPVGCTPEEIGELVRRSTTLLGTAPCRQYIDLLRQLDGIMYDGNTIYAHKTHPLYGPGAVTSRAVGSPDIDGFVELNQLYRERYRVESEVMIYGSNEVWLFIGYGESRFCYIPSGYPVWGEPLVAHVDKEFATFNEMLLDIFEQLLERAHDRGEIAS